MHMWPQQGKEPLRIFFPTNPSICQPEQCTINFSITLELHYKCEEKNPQLINYHLNSTPRNDANARASRSTNNRPSQACAHWE